MCFLFRLLSYMQWCNKEIRFLSHVWKIYLQYFVRTPEVWTLTKWEHCSTFLQAVVWIVNEFSKINIDIEWSCTIIGYWLLFMLQYGFKILFLQMKDYFAFWSDLKTFLKFCWLIHCMWKSVVYLKCLMKYFLPKRKIFWNKSYIKKMPYKLF